MFTGRVTQAWADAANYTYATVDLTSRKWIATILVSEATGVQDQA
jgi:hypothetical protein